MRSNLPVASRHRPQITAHRSPSTDVLLKIFAFCVGVDYVCVMPNQPQPNQYDKILHENLAVTLPVIIREVLGLDIIASEDLPDGVQHTKERIPDVLRKVTDALGNVYVLHIEFQVKNDRDMVYRMAEYSVMLLRKYRLPVRQYVIYLGDGKVSMPTAFHEERHVFSYQLIAISGVDYELFLKSDNPEVRMLAILGDLRDPARCESIVRDIVLGIHAGGVGDFARSRYFKQLRIFVQLRSSIVHQFEKVMETVTTFFKEENDYLFRKGELKGELKGKLEGKLEGELQERRAIALELKKEGLSLSFIARITKLSIEEIEKLEG